ncbi:MAG: hypothetical protein N4A62_05825 [Marinisporobacter sp.]|jgi:RHS repeat-associated protein|nr:hypothetical protein [Marinisporobacter sp.]
MSATVRDLMALNESTSSDFPYMNREKDTIGKLSKEQLYNQQFDKTKDLEDTVDRASGSLTYKEVDCIFPGKDGLDFALGRIYNSDMAQLAQYHLYNTFKIYNFPQNVKYITIKAYALDKKTGNTEQRDYCIYYDRWMDAERAYNKVCDLWNNGNLFRILNGAFNIEVRSIMGVTGVRQTNVHVGTHDRAIVFENKISQYNYPLERYNLGVGWSFNLPSIQNVSKVKNMDEQYFHDGSGHYYRIDFESEDNYSHLEGYQGKNLQLLKDNDSYSYGGRTSKYKLITADKKETYFSQDGAVIGIKDRFNNQIKFSYANNKLKQIIDSVGRIIDFTYNTVNSREENIVVTVKSPNTKENKTVTYTKFKNKVTIYPLKNIHGLHPDHSHENPAVKYMSYLRKVTHNDTAYAKVYEYENEYMNFLFNKKNIEDKDYASKIPVQLLSSVIHCHKDEKKIDFRRKFEYEKVKRNLGRDGAKHDFRIKAKYDQNRLYNKSNKRWFWGEKENLVNYTYFKDCSGYPNYSSSTDIPESFRFGSQMAADKIKSKTTFDGKQRFIQIEVIANNGEKKVDKNLAFDSTFDKKPIKIQNIEYDSNGQVSKDLYVEKAYTDWGGVRTITQPLTLRELNNRNIKTKYTTTFEYHPTFKFVTKKQWYQNADKVLTEGWIYYDSGNAVGRLRRYTDPQGKQTVYEYQFDGRGNVIKTTQKIILDDGKVAKTETIYGSETNYAYPKEIRVYHKENSREICTKSLNTYYMLTGLTKEVTDNANNKVFYEYDGLGRVIAITKPNFTNHDGETYKVKDLFSYNDYCLGANEDGSYEYQGKVYSRTMCTTNPTDTAKGYFNKTCLYHNYYGNLVKEILYDVEKNDWVTQQQYLYDNFQKPIAQIDGNSNRTDYGYDNWGRVHEVKDCFGNLYKTAYDLKNHLKINYFVPKEKVASYKANPSNDALKENVEETVFDLRNRPIEKRVYPQWPNRSNPFTSKIAYDTAGNKTSYIDPKKNVNENGVTVKYQYDELNRLVQVKDALNHITQIQYDALDNIESIFLKENSNATPVKLYTKEFDELGKITKKMDTAEHNEIYKYNQLNLLESITDRLENQYQYTYDKHMRPFYDKIQSKNNLNKMEYKYNYKTPNNVSQINSYENGALTGNTLYNYNSRNQIIYKHIEHALDKYSSHLVNQYDILGRLTSSAIGKDKHNLFSTNYNYDKTRIDTIKVGKHGTIKYEYYSDGKLKSTIYPQLNNGTYITSSYTYNKLNQLESITNKKGSVVLSRFSYSYDHNGNIKTITDSKGTTTFKYDKLNRLIEVSHPTEGKTTYTYDLRGNRKTASGTSYVFNFENMNYQHNVKGQLTQITKDNSNIEFKYNSEGLRYKKQTPSKVTQYHYDLGGKVIAESDENGNILCNYVWGAGHVLMKIDAMTGSKYCYLYNGHGDVVQIVDQNGNVVNSYEYDVWGNIKNQKETIENPFKYAGEIYDKETGLYYLRARYYDPTIGRFISEDSYEGQVTNPLSLNLYTYCYNNPLMHVDPSGHEPRTMKIGDKYYFVPTDRAMELMEDGAGYVPFGGFVVWGVEKAGGKLLKFEKFEHDDIGAATATYLDALSNFSDYADDFIGKAAGIFGAGLTTKSLFEEFYSTDYQLDETIDFIVGSSLTSDSREKVIAKYLYTKQVMTELIKKGDVSYKYEKEWFGISSTRTSISYKPEVIEQLKKELNSLFEK